MKTKQRFKRKLTDSQIKDLTEKATYEGMHIGIKSAWETMLERRSVLKTVLDGKSYREVNRIMFPEQPIEEEDNATTESGETAGTH
ncbi:hypothetical protein [Bacillus thuringiensis]|uniref:hypothetical protein n=1 Tax=Bacillus thuringiensis TaxID=1428 RepID=UPI000BF4E838|nr:hypothetical protein [Bacillus thuringiensis]PFD30349.1 hypothetical protein CN278_25630 [Bacillus thuringiensis]